MQIASPQGIVIYDQLLFSNIEDATGRQLNTIVKKGHTFTAPTTGAYSFCLDNKMARWTAKVVTFELEVKSNAARLPVGQVRTEGDEDHDTVEYMRTAAERLHGKLLTIENSQFYHFHREKRHRETLESTNTRVVFWTVTEAIVVLLLTAGQIVMVRTWFSKQGNAPGGRMGV